MRTLVLGGIRSGKSRWAERAVCAEAPVGAAVRYLATAVGDDSPEWRARVAAHRERRPAHWVDVETPDLVTALRTDPDSATLVDDVGGWLTAAMDRRQVWTAAAGTGSNDDVGAGLTDEVRELTAAVAAMRAVAVLVSPEVGLTVVPATRAGRLFADTLGRVNQDLAEVCETVVLVVAGHPLAVKGVLPGNGVP